ncbi:CsgG/HfaB family protein [Alkaliflexus imshenetskii]|uniref:CsgG/HfaB family protein n=1 Tax=Alkaliflexus imshenetskii TaxID=286730 RepID=UPI000694CC6D|nr:CsgG/HfaB family protein [Alkaliflexus imshenetskii]
MFAPFHIKNSLFTGFNLLMLLFISGCASTFRHPFSPAPARFGEFSSVHKKEISQLPQPREKVYAAVYSFRDQTGQYKLTENAASWSTVVTQGATSVLIQALEESNWFIAIEREGLSNLLNERRIIRQTQEQFQGSGTLSPLLYAGIIIEGGIIAYETNIRTGGAGARYFGTGASGQYREDQVTIYLRAVSTSTGRILKTVHASKTILSQKMDMGMFRFVSLQKLLEAETGYTFNEPAFLAVQEAIDKAVFALIVEGIADELWSLKTPGDITLPVIRDYFDNRDNQYDTDYLGNIQVQRTKCMSVGLDASGILYDGDVKSEKLNPGAVLTLGFMKRKQLSLDWELGISNFNNELKAKMAFSGLNLQYTVFNHFANSPWLTLGYGVSYHTSADWFSTKAEWNANTFQYIQAGAGYRWQLLEDKLGISISAKGRFYMNDEFDGLVQGKLNDRLWYFNLGIDYRFNLSKYRQRAIKI